MDDAQAISKMRKLLIILGIPIDHLNMDEALQRIDEFVRIGRRTGKTHQIATVNADFAVNALHDPELRQLLVESDMATADGMPLVWGARLLGVPMKERVTGADMVPALAKLAAKKGYTMYFLGAAPGVAEQAARILEEQAPGLQILGTVSPPYGSILEMDRAYIDDIKAKKPDILLVAFGNPKQEKWIGMYGREIGVPVMMGVGGTLDFIAGKTRRAPVWMQRTGLEWIYRLLQEPRRLWRRYVVDMVGFSSFFVRQWWLMRTGRGPETLLPDSDLILIDRQAVINVQGRLEQSNLATFNSLAQQAFAECDQLIVNLQQATFMDSTAIGSLVGLAKRAQERNGRLVLASVPPPILRALSLLRLDRFFPIVDSVEGGFENMQETNLSDVPVSPQGDWAVATMPKRFDASNAEEVRDQCMHILESNPHLVLDFSNTTFLASAGLAAMSALNKIAHKKEGEIRLAACSDDVLRVVQLVRFDKVFSVYDDVTAAVV